MIFENCLERNPVPIYGIYLKRDILRAEHHMFSNTCSKRSTPLVYVSLVISVQVATLSEWDFVLYAIAFFSAKDGLFPFSFSSLNEIPSVCVLLRITHHTYVRTFHIPFPCQMYSTRYIIWCRCLFVRACVLLATYRSSNQWKSSTLCARAHSSSEQHARVTTACGIFFNSSFRYSCVCSRPVGRS